jgi:CelD/BcsL family acetyltransferase involved in cellulose biosynthesis
MAFDPNYSNLYPSKLLLYELVKYCHANNLKEFHFMRGETDYKSKWTKTHRINYRFTFQNRKSLYGKISALGEAFLK